MEEEEDPVELLIDGARYDDAEDVGRALAGGVSVNSQDDQGRTALHMAAANGHLEMIQLLLDKGASVDIGNAEGNIPLHWACINGHIDAVRLLMENLSDASKLNEHERTPVDEALGRGFQEIVDLIGTFNKGEDELEDQDDPEDLPEDDQQI